MGMFDRVHVHGPAFVCSEGHDLSGEEFQTKDFACVLDDVSMALGEPMTCGGRAGLGFAIKANERPYNATVEVYCDCTQCPCFVQARTFNLCPVGVNFEVVIENDIVMAVKRTSPTTAEFLETEPKQGYMDGCLGPMTRDEAEAMRQEHWRQVREVR